MAALSKELREYLFTISPYEGHSNYFKERFESLGFAEAIQESRLIHELADRNMIVPSQESTIHTWDVDDRSLEEHKDEALVEGLRCVSVPDWFVLSYEGLNYGQTRRRRNVKWIITAVLAPFVLWMITVLLPILANVVAAWWFSAS